MQWMELIKVRTAGLPWRDQAADLIERALESLTDFSGLEVSVYRHASLPDDLGLTLVWKAHPAQPDGSHLALGLSRELEKNRPGSPLGLDRGGLKPPGRKSCETHTPCGACTSSSAS